MATLLVAGGTVAYVGAAQTAPTASTIPFAPYGNELWGAAASPVPLTSTTFLVTAQGPDETVGTADDVVLLVTSADTTPAVATLATPNLGENGQRITRLSATRALVCAAGPDQAWTTADDVVFILDRLGSGNTVTPVTVGYLIERGASAVRLTADSAVVPTSGPDGFGTTADDTVALLTGLGTGASVAQLPAPYLSNGGGARPVALSPSAFLVVSRGADEAAETSDDAVHLFTDVGGASVRTTLATPYLLNGRPSMPVRVGRARAVVSSLGADGVRESADDGVYLLDDLGGINTVTPISVPYIFDYGAGQPTVIDETSVIVATRGSNGVGFDADDALVLLSGLGTTNSTTSIVVGPLEEDAECRPVRLSADTCAVVTFGETGAEADAIKVVADLGGANAVTGIAVPGLADGVTSNPERLSTSALMVSNGGANAAIGNGADDTISVISGIGTVAVVETVSTGFDLAEGGGGGDAYNDAYAPKALGQGRGVHLAPGADLDLGTGGDDVMRLLRDLPQGDALTVKLLQIKHNAAKPETGEKLKVVATLLLEETALFGTTDLTISIGDTAQTIPAGAFTIKDDKTDDKYAYLDKEGAQGFLTKVQYNSTKGTLKIAGKGVATGAQSTLPGYITFGLDSESFLLNQVYRGIAGKKGGVKYKAP
ncbi:MAG: hypothetical protein HY899_02890 [Deltaproteobacteria bacterium]|nr:hypothetical protein [Deltaproteobacteria bacterium]